MRRALATLVIALVAAFAASRASAQDQVFNTDVIVIGSECVGTQCVNGESFGFDTIRLKEDNLRIKFEDTSAVAGFPSNDWQLTANDSASGGANKFSIDDITGAKTPFTVEAGAPTNSLYVEFDGDVGFGTANPVVNLHAVDGNTPTLRLEQNGSSGFTAQTWDLASNETNFFIRDVTNGSKLPFRIQPSAPTNSIYIKSTGEIGMGAGTAPTARLHVRDDAAGEATRVMLKLENKNGGRTRAALINGAITWLLENEGSAFNVTRAGSGLNEFSVRSNGDAVIAGNSFALSHINTSSRASKERFAPVDRQALLERVARLPIEEWSYKLEPERRHVGPVAEDFQATFGLSDGNGISTVDASGVALVAIQGLYEQLRRKESDLAGLQRENGELEARIEALEAIVLAPPREARLGKEQR